MDSRVYTEYLAAWSASRAEEVTFPLPETVTKPILDDLYQTYRDFRSKNVTAKINLVEEKLVYDRSMRRHGFRSIFEFRDSQGAVEHIRLTTYIRTSHQQVIHQYRKQFQKMARTIFGMPHTLGVKIRCDPTTHQFQFQLRIIRS